MKEMARLLHSLREELKSHTDSLLDYKESCIESHGEWISQGWCEALAFAINQVEESMYEEVQVTKHMSIKQKKGAVNALNYLLTGERGTHGTEESN